MRQHEAVFDSIQVGPLHETLREVLDGSIGITGAMVATTEGMLVAGEFAPTAAVSSQDDVETIAAMSASAIAIALQFVGRLSLGSTTGCVVHASRGCVAVQRAGTAGVLILFGGDGLTVARLNLAVRQALPRVHDVLARLGI